MSKRQIKREFLGAISHLKPNDYNKQKNMKQREKLDPPMRNALANMNRVGYFGWTGTRPGEREEFYPTERLYPNQMRGGRSRRKSRKNHRLALFGRLTHFGRLAHLTRKHR